MADHAIPRNNTIASSVEDAGDGDGANLSAWSDFLLGYSKGHFPLDEAPAAPEAEGPLTPGANLPDLSVESIYGGPKLDTEIARRVRRFYRTHGFLPPPHSFGQTQRERVIHEYDLQGTAQRENAFLATGLLQAHFGEACTFTLYSDGGEQWMEAVSTDLETFPLAAGDKVQHTTALCSHCVLRTDGNIMQHLQVLDLEADWRFRRNPYGAVVKGWFGVPISLPSDATDPDNTQTVPIGVLNVMNLTRPWTTPTPKQLRVLRNAQKMLETQFRATWEGARRNQQAAMCKVVNDFVGEALGSAGHVPAGAGGEEPSAADTFARLAQEASAHSCRLLPQAEVAAVIDARGVGARHASNGKTHYSAIDTTVATIRLLGFTQKVPALPGGEVTLLASPSGAFADTLSSPKGARAVVDYFTSLHASAQSLDSHAGLGSLLPPGTAYVAVPYWVADQPAFVVLVTSRSPKLPLDASESGFVTSLGTILQSLAVRNRVLDADRAKTAFLSSISHEYRIPLHGVLSYLELLEVPDPIGQDLLRSAKVCGQELSKKFNDLLDFRETTVRAKADDVDSFTSPPSRQSDVQLDDLVQRVVSTCVQQRDEWTSAFAVANSSPPVTVAVEVQTIPSWFVRLDAVTLSRILATLVNNALKFTRQGSVTVRLGVNPGSDSTVELEVIDTGIGVDKAFLPLLFEPFHQADTFTDGAGLGLYLCRGLVDSVQGTLSVSAGPNATGSSFRVTVPAEFHCPARGALSRPEKLEAPDRQLALDITTRPSPAATPQSAIRIADGGSPALRILIVDDNSIARKVLVHLVRKMQSEVGAGAVLLKEAVDGVDAVARFTEFRPHLVWTDISMPNMDGVQAAEAMRKWEASQQWPRSRIIAVTGLGSSDPRLKLDAMLGDSAFDEWRVKGQGGLDVFTSDVRELQASMVTEW